MIEKPKDNGQTQNCIGIMSDLVDRSGEVVVGGTIKSCRSSCCVSHAPMPSYFSSCDQCDWRESLFRRTQSLLAPVDAHRVHFDALSWHSLPRGLNTSSSDAVTRHHSQSLDIQYLRVPLLAHHGTNEFCLLPVPRPSRSIEHSPHQLRSPGHLQLSRSSP